MILFWQILTTRLIPFLTGTALDCSPSPWIFGWALQCSSSNLVQWLLIIQHLNKTSHLFVRASLSWSTMPCTLSLQSYRIKTCLKKIFLLFLVVVLFSIYIIAQLYLDLNHNQKFVINYGHFLRKKLAQSTHSAHEGNFPI